MKKLKMLKLEALDNMLTRDQMKKIIGGYGPCNGYGTTCGSGGLGCCGTCGCDVFWGCGVCK